MEDSGQLKLAVMDATAGAIAGGMPRTATPPLDVIKDRFQSTELSKMVEDDFYGDTIMSVELAIRRELAYRRKLALQLKRDDDFLKDLIPLQVHSSTSGPIKNRPTSSHIYSGAKRKEPSSVYQPQYVALEKQSFHGSHDIRNNTFADNDLHCKLCNVECSSHFNLKQHMRGQKHQARLQQLAKGQRRWCQVCGVPCMNEDLLKMHLEGKKHKSKLTELGLSAATKSDFGENVPAEQWQSLYCKLCRVWCSNEGCFKQHLEGRKHKLQLL